MIYTIGYQRLSVDFLDRLLTALDARLVDCRFKPFSRRPGFSAPDLARRYGGRYDRRGDELGGFGHTTPQGIARLRAERRNVILMCAEEAPGDCHRHHAICGPHVPDAIHIHQGDLIRARELQRAIDEDDGYEICGSVADLLRR
jgi:hypothetical protein